MLKNFTDQVTITWFFSLKDNHRSKKIEGLWNPTYTKHSKCMQLNEVKENQKLIISVLSKPIISICPWLNRPFLWHGNISNLSQTIEGTFISIYDRVWTCKEHKTSGYRRAVIYGKVPRLLILESREKSKYFFHNT